MNILKLLDQFDKDEMSKDELDIFSSRRAAFKKMGSYTKKMSLAAIPAVIFTAMPKIAFGRSTGSAVSILNFAYVLEQLEYQFYEYGVNASGLIPSDTMDVFMLIRKHEDAHRSFLREVIISLGGSPYDLGPENFDFTAGGAFPDVFNNYQTFLAFSQGFEDLGVRAYKGQATNIQALGDSATVNQVLTTALSIHGVEARHASMVRRLREQKGWITGIDRSLPEQFLAIYLAGMPPEMFPAEDNVVQGGVNLMDALGGIEGIDMAAITEAFDEPLDANTANLTGTVYDLASLVLDS